MSRILQSSWFVALASCLLYLATTAALLHPEDLAGARKAQSAHRSPDDDPAWKFRNPEFEQWIEEIKTEKEALNLRDQQLHELQTRLDAERQEILSLTQAVQQLQMNFDSGVVRFKAQEADNIKRQTKLLAGMSPDGAAAMLSEMKDDDIVRLLFSLKADQSSAILDSMSKSGKAEAKRAADLALRIRKVLPAPPASTPQTKP
jgi:flagellar motility protein MotE (MotC chaperone)